MLTISDRHQPTWNLMGDYFTFTPNSRDLRNFELDMKTLNPPMLRDAIAEAIKAKKVDTIYYTDQRRAIHEIYTRKIKEFSSIYPFFFTVENALRSCLADHLERFFGRMDWWVIIRDAIVNGDGPETFNDETVEMFEEPRSIIRGKKVTPALVALIFKTINDLRENSSFASKISGDDKSDEFYYCLTLGQIWKIIDVGWTIIRPMFCDDASLTHMLTRKIFNDWMRVIKDARNDLFHSNPIRNRIIVISCAEKLMNCLDFHLGDFDIALGDVQYVRPQPGVRREKRHGLPGR
jgi:hypothetical protein